MRAVNITGKHNIDQLKKIGNAGYKAERKHMTHLDEMVATHKCQMDVLRKIYIVGTDYIDNQIDISLILSELNHKIQGYKDQDRRKDLHNQIITFDNVLEKLVASQLTCCYCSKPIVVLYKNVRDPMQWTLDRVDNALGHTSDNTCISCLRCNLQRRVMDAEKFSFTKKLKIQKL